MSIRKQIEDACDCGALRYLPPELGGADSERCIFVSEEVWDAAYSHHHEADPELAELYAGMRATLDHYSMGGQIPVGWTPRRKDGAALVARVEPLDSRCWDFRCLDPEPGIRVLGFFAETNVFIALTWHYRDSLESSDDWDGAITEARRLWDGLFSGPPFKGSNVGDHISKNANPC